MITFWWVIGVILIAPSLTFYVVKFGTMGFLRGRQSFHKFFDERGKSNGDK